MKYIRVTIKSVSHLKINNMLSIKNLLLGVLLLSAAACKKTRWKILLLPLKLFRRWQAQKLPKEKAKWVPEALMAAAL